MMGIYEKIQIYNSTYRYRYLKIKKHYLFSEFFWIRNFDTWTLRITLTIGIFWIMDFFSKEFGVMKFATNPSEDANS
jgi:hypothetical protein